MEETCGTYHKDKYRELAPETENLALNWRVNQGYILREVMSVLRRVEYKSQQGLEWILEIIASQAVETAWANVLWQGYHDYWRD